MVGGHFEDCDWCQVQIVFLTVGFEAFNKRKAFINLVQDL